MALFAWHMMKCNSASLHVLHAKRVHVARSCDCGLAKGSTTLHSACCCIRGIKETYLEGVVEPPLCLDPSDGVFGQFDLAAFCACHTLNFCLLGAMMAALLKWFLER